MTRLLLVTLAGGGPGPPVYSGKAFMSPPLKAFCSAVYWWSWSAVAACERSRRKGFTAAVPFPALFRKFGLLTNKAPVRLMTDGVADFATNFGSFLRFAAFG